MDKQEIRWTGEDGLLWSACLEITGQAPCITSLGYRKAGQYYQLAGPLGISFKVIASKRTKNNPQRLKQLEEGEELHYQWDTYSDDPMSHKADVHEAKEQWETTQLSIKRDGNVQMAEFDGLIIGAFRGICRCSFYEGSNLIRIEAIASTKEDGTAYLYHAGLTGLEIGKLYYVAPNRKEILENPGFQTHSGPDRDRQRVDARNRTLTLGQSNGSLAVFPPPHRFFWGCQTENIVGYNYYHRREDGKLDIGIRHNKQAENHNVRWACYNAPPETEQHMVFFTCVSSDSVWVTRAMAMKYTNFDHLRELKGYKRLCAHMHIASHAAWIRDIRKERPWERLLKEIGCDIFAICDFWGEGNVADNKDKRIEEMERYLAMARCCSTPDFLVIPAEELSARREKGEHMLVPFHCMLMPSKPLLYSRWRDDDQVFDEKLPDGRTYYHLKSAEDLVEMCRRENCFILMPHPDTKANDGLPYLVKDEDWFQDERWFGIGCRQLPADNSYRTMLDGRSSRVWNDINNWSCRPRYIISELDTYSKVEETEADWDIYGLNNVTYVKLDQLPKPDNWEELIDALREGNHFYSTGEILLENSEIEDGKAKATLSWTFPLSYASVVYSDGKQANETEISLSDTKPFGKRNIEITFPKGMKWARVLATDIAGNSVFGQPVFLRSCEQAAD